ncbi:hypothetical protein K0U27_05550 [archaeon]|nr:hypothetical protein [archaeon]
MKRNARPDDVMVVKQKVLFWIIIVAAVVAISVGIVGLGHVQSSDNTSTNTTTVDRNNSSPFSINKQDYTSDEKIFFVASRTGHDGKGDAVIKRPNGDEALRIPFDDSKSSTISRYFEISSLYDEKCKDCNFGTGKISFESGSGSIYTPINFKVTRENSEKEEYDESRN